MKFLTVQGEFVYYFETDDGASQVTVPFRFLWML